MIQHPSPSLVLSGPAVRPPLARGLGARLLLPWLAASLSAQGLVNGGFVDGAITVPGERITHTFDASGGENFQLRILDLNASALYPTITVFDPLSNQVATRGGQDVAAISGSAPRTGTYRVVVADGNSNPNQTGPYRLQFVLAPGANEGGALTNGQTVADTVTIGDLDSFTFAINAGESYQLRVADVNSTALYPFLTVYDPQGALVVSNGALDVAAVADAAAVTGVYTVVVADGNSTPSQAGAYELHYVRAPGANTGGALINGGAVAGSVRLGALDSYTFAITAGESYELRLSDSNSTALYPRMTLYDPRGCLVRQNGNLDVAALSGVADFSGTYTVIVADGNSHPAQTGAYRIHFVRAPGANAGGALPIGGSVAGTIALGDLDSFTFDIQAGESYLIRVSDTRSTALYPRLTVYDPRGSFVAQNGGLDVAALGAVATQSGTYTVVVADGNSHPAQTGDYRVHFVRAPGASAGGPLRNSGSVVGAIGLGELDSFSLALRAGESYAVRVVDSLGTALYPRILLYDPRGTFVAQAAAQDVATLSGTAAFSGTYTLVVTDGNGAPAQTGGYEVHLARAPGANEHGFLLDGVSVTETIVVGDLDSYTFRARAGDTARITLTDTLAGSLYPTITLYDPSGAYLAQIGNVTTAVLNRLIARDGTHTIVVSDGNGAATGAGPYSLVVAGAGYVGNSGCSNEGPPLLSGAPSLSTGFVVSAPTFSRTCTGAALVILGPCAASPIVLPPSTTCGSCGLQVASILISLPGQVVIPPLSSALVGVTLCAQAACRVGPCISLSAALPVTLER